MAFFHFFFLTAYSAIAAPSSWATLPKLKASRPFGPKRFGPCSSVPMHEPSASLPWLIASWVAGAANSTSHVTSSATAPLARSFCAHAFAWEVGGFTIFVSHWMIFSFRPLTPPLALMRAASNLAASRAALSNGFMIPDRSTAALMMIGFFAAGAAWPPVVPTTAAIATAAARNATSALHLVALLTTPPLVYDPTPRRKPSPVLDPGGRGGSIQFPGGLAALDQAVHRRVQRHGDAEPLRLPHKRAGDVLDLRRAVRLDVLEHRGVVATPALRREHVHFPRVLVQLHARGRRDRLSLLDEAEDEVAEVARPLARREVRVVRQARQRGDRVDGGVEDQLRPLGRPQIAEGAGFEAGCDDQRRDALGKLVRRAAVGPEPGLGVEDVLDVRVGVLRPAHERHRREHAAAREGFLRAEAVLDSHGGGTRPVPLEPRRRRADRGRLGSDDCELGLGELRRVGRGVDARHEVAAPGDAQSFSVQRPRVL